MDDAFELTPEGAAEFGGDASDLLDKVQIEWDDHDFGRALAALLRSGPADEETVMQWLKFMNETVVSYTVLSLVLKGAIDVRWSPEDNDFVYGQPGSDMKKKPDFDEALWSSMLGWDSADV